MNRQSFYLPGTAARGTVIERIAKVLAHLPMGQAFRLELAEHHPRRSDNQNRYLWGVVYPTILKAGGNTLAGWTADDLHEYCLGEHFGWEEIAGLGKRRLRPLRRSSRLTKMEFVDFIAFIQRRMSEFGIYVPDPNEYEDAEVAA